MIVRKWSICRANLDPVIGSEQGKSRPVLIISEDEINDILNTVNVIPITSRKSGRRIYPNEILIPANNTITCYKLVYTVLVSPINRDFILQNADRVVVIEQFIGLLQIPYRYNFGLDKESIILCHQIQTLDKQRISQKYGQISDTEKQNEILDALCFQIGIDRGIDTTG